jgi:hypothetical protein
VLTYLLYETLLCFISLDDKHVFEPLDSIALGLSSIQLNIIDEQDMILLIQEHFATPQREQAVHLRYPGFTSSP